MIGSVCAEKQDTRTGSSQADTVNFLDSYLPDGTWSHWLESESGTWWTPCFMPMHSGLVHFTILYMIHSRAGKGFDGFH